MEEFLDLHGGVGRYVKANGQESNDFPGFWNSYK